MFVIHLADGEEVHGESEELSINQDTGVLTVCKVDGFEETTTHYSPIAWRTVTHRKRDIGVRPSLISSARCWPEQDFTAYWQLIHIELTPLGR